MREVVAAARRGSGEDLRLQLLELGVGGDHWVVTPSSDLFAARVLHERGARTRRAFTILPMDGRGDVEIVEPERAPYVRRPSDLLRLLLEFAALLIGLGIALLAQDAIISFNESLLQFVDGLGHARQHIIQDSVGAFIAAVVLVAIIVLLLLRRWRALGYLVLADVVAECGSILMAKAVHHLEPRTFAARTTSTFLPNGAFHGTGVLAGLVAIVAVSSPWMNRRWRRFAWAAIILAAVTRLATSPPPSSRRWNERDSV